MKFLLVTLLLLMPLARAHEKNPFSSGKNNSISTGDELSRRGKLTLPEKILNVEELNRVLFSEMKIQNNELKKVKYYLLNGETRLAKVYLSKLANTQTKLRPVINRYLAVLSFTEGNFDKVLKYLSVPDLDTIPHFGKICVLKILSLMVLNKTRILEDQWGRCQIENANQFKEENLIWVETLVQLKVNPRTGITKAPFKRMKLAALENEEIKMMMKLALYLNQEQIVIDQLPDMEVEQLQDVEIRELIGQALFRSGSLARAYRYIEDLKSPNSENIKGNLYILREKYELAYAQFKLALEQKQNSQNAMERLLPLAWLLGDWEGGARYTEQVIASPQTQINKMTLMAAFYMQKGDYEKSDQILTSIAKRSRRGGDIEVTQLASFTALMQNRPFVAKKQALMSCSQYDLINCWVLYQLSQWDAFPLTIRRDEAPPTQKLWEKLTKEDIVEPLQETVFVNQLDIEELDDKLIQLIPDT